MYNILIIIVVVNTTTTNNNNNNNIISIIMFKFPKFLKIISIIILFQCILF